MFLFNSLESGESGSLRRCYERSALALFVLLCLSLTLLFTGCNTGSDPLPLPLPVEGIDSRLIGRWESSFSETYEITSTHLTYTGFDGISWGGTIASSARFDNNTGVVIIQYDTDKKQQWAIYDAGFNITGYHDTTGRDFYGIYFRNLTQNSVVLSNTSDQANNWGPSETTTLPQAISRFTFDSMPNWIDLSFATAFDRMP